jgi:hypothetical protein
MGRLRGVVETVTAVIYTVKAALTQNKTNGYVMAVERP